LTNWNIQNTLEWIQGYLERKRDENPRLSAQWLLSEVTGLSRIELYTHFDKPLSVDERERLRGFVERRGSGEPLQYITGEVGFRHITIKVRPGVLIPRPETEVLVSEALACLPKEKSCDRDLDSNASLAKETQDQQGELLVDGIADEQPEQRVLVADICTGSGCIACSVAHEYPSAEVIATDIAPEAVALATANVEKLGLSDRVTVLESDLGQAISDELLNHFDLVISNPPYIPQAVLQELPSEVANFEPHLALAGGQDGLDVFRALLLWTYDALRCGGTFAVELHETRLELADQLAKDAGFTFTRIALDLAGRPRILLATK